MKNKWIKVEKKIPEYSVWVLVYDGVNNVGIGILENTDRNGHHWTCYGNANKNDIFGWQPLPEPPGFEV